MPAGSSFGAQFAQQFVSARILVVIILAFIWPIAPSICKSSRDRRTPPLETRPTKRFASYKYRPLWLLFLSFIFSASLYYFLYIFLYQSVCWQQCIPLYELIVCHLALSIFGISSIGSTRVVATGFGWLGVWMFGGLAVRMSVVGNK